MKTTTSWLVGPLAFATAIVAAGCGTRAAGEAIDASDEVASVGGTCPDLEFSVDGMLVSTDASTHFEDGSCAEIIDGRGVEVEGVARDGVLYASEVDLD